MTKLQTIKLVHEVKNNELINKDWGLYLTKRAELWALLFANKNTPSCFAYFFLKEESVNTISHMIHYECRLMQTPDDAVQDAWKIQPPFLLDTVNCPQQKEYSKEKLSVEDIILRLNNYVVDFTISAEKINADQLVINSTWDILGKLKLKGIPLTKVDGVYSAKVTGINETIDFVANLATGGFSGSYNISGLKAIDLIKQVAEI